MATRVDSDAAQFALAHGGVIFIWPSGAGLVHISAKAPKGSTDWEPLPDDGVEVRPFPVERVEIRVAPSLRGVESWHVALRRFPRKTLVATSEFTRSPGQDLIGPGL